MEVPVRTSWTDTPGDNCIRRTITLPATATCNLTYLVYHDEDVQIYVNGVLAANEGGYDSE